MTERTVGTLRLATMAGAATSICILAACASSEPARSTPETTPESSAAGTTEPAPATGEPSSAEATGSPQESPADAAPEDPGAAPGAPAGSAAEGPGTEEPSEDGGSGSVSDEEVEAFVEVQLELESVRRDLMTEAKQQDADVAELQRELEEHAEELVEDSPLSLTRFQKIGQRLMRDPGLQERVRAEMEEQAGS